MNIHVPQTIQTATELWLIANAGKRFISPATSQIVINAVQDTAMGSYQQTYDSIKVDWKDAMNILMSTSTGLNGSIPKGKMVSGKWLYSQIIPPEINIVKKKDDGSYAVRVSNGQITNGFFGKPEIKAIVQKTWFQYGSKVSVNFIDDLQRMVLQWLMRQGFTMGIKNIIIPKETTSTVATIIETKRKEILHTITDYENDPFAITRDAFEISMMANLQSIQGNVEKTVMATFTTENNIQITISSGASGTSMNAGQIMGCIGQVVVEGKRILKRFNNRTLPMFHQHDDSAFARGFCHSSFVSGLGPAEFFFQVMSGREGIINTAIKTADTGYIQRKLIKIMEDIKVGYDSMVRNANDKVIQLVYGGNGINTECQVEQKIALITQNNKSVREKYTYSDDELKDLLKKQKSSSKYTMDLNESLYVKLISMRDHMRQVQRVYNISTVAFKDSYMMPLDLQQYITNIVNRDGRDHKEVVDPYYVLAEIKDMYSGSQSKIMKFNDKTSKIKKSDDQKIKFLLKFYLYDTLAPKKCTHVYKFSTEEFDEIVEQFKHVILLSRVEGGEMVGFVAAQSIGEPVSQANLKSFHKAGTGAGVSGGLPRVKEILSVTKNIKTPSTRIVLEDRYKEDKVIANKIGSYLKYTTMSDVVNDVEIYYDPDPYSKTSIMTRDGVTNIFEVSQGKSGCQSEINGLPWIIRMTLSKEKMVERNITLLEIKSNFCYNWSMRFEDNKGPKKEYKKVIDKISQCAIVSNFDNSPTPIIHIRFDANNYNFNTMLQFQEMIISKYKIKGIIGINESNNIIEEKYNHYDSEGNIVKKDQYVIHTEGINLHEMAQINGINLNETTCNDIVMVYETYGIEAARTVLIRELTQAIESSGVFSNYQHIELLIDAITHMGGLIAVSRHGANKLDTDPLSKASFEKTVEKMLDAAVFSETDYIRSVSSRIMVGGLINGGTGCFDLLLDHLAVKRAFKPTTESTSEKRTIKKNTTIADLIKKKKGIK
jgi:DNA-directed RNA polymerase II subunit RPB1